MDRSTRAFLLSAILAICGASLAYAEVKYGVELLSGYSSDEAMRNGMGGREAQVWTIHRALVTLDISRDNVGVYLEPVLLSNESGYDPDSRINRDYYRNLGTDLYYYGDEPLREGYFYWKPGRHDIRIGRQQSLMGLPFGDIYLIKHHAPHAVYLDQELLTGIRYGYSLKYMALTGAIFGGRGRPSTSYNFQHHETTGPNSGGNNTPALEIRADLGTDRYGGHIAYRHNKTGSAPGRSVFSGKHNDNRFTAGAYYTATLAGVTLSTYGQYSHHLFGLTESGSQGNNTPDLSHDITKSGWFVTSEFDWQGAYIRLTYEEIDRADSNVWDRVAEHDKRHPVMSDIERNSIISAGYRRNSITVEVYYKDPDYSHPESVHVRGDLEKFGLLVRYAFDENL